MSFGAGAQSRFKAIGEIATRQPRKFHRPTDENGRPLEVSEFFGVNTFDLKKMKDQLPRDAYRKLVATIEEGQKLDSDVAETVAVAVKEWALARGATHFTHWFQPQTGLTAEKHDAFLSFDEDRNPVESFSGAQLIQSEPDASSFPSGGMRSTFEARGYTAWDPTSPMFLMESTNGKTLCIPSAYISYTGHALDKKTGLLRSIEALSRSATRMLGLIGYEDAKRVVPSLGAEQEYFLVDRGLFNLRPDLVMSGRSLVGGQPPRGQQLEDHYFGSIPSRVQAFMQELELELYKLGVPVKTRHNEVAPSQFETAPIFAEANVATDHNQLTMEMLKKVAARHNLQVLLHEKPFAELNGNGKHCNWSAGIVASGPKLDGTNLLDPGKTPATNLRFLMMLSGVLLGVHKHAGLLRAAIASSGNDHRLGANEAPPAIISVFLGDTLTQILNTIETDSTFEGDGEDSIIRLGLSKLPEIMKDNTDRNRTSPFAFTGNKFEFRAVGSSASTALPAMYLNAAVADGLNQISTMLEEKLKGSKLEKAAFAVIREAITSTKAVRFEGDNYSDDWVKEAAQRGLPNLRKTPEALDQMVTEQSKTMLSELKIFDQAEIVSRYNVRLERYVKSMMIEVDALCSMIDTQILPACFAYHSDLAQGADRAKNVGVAAPQTEVVNRLATYISELQTKRTALEGQLDSLEKITDERKIAEALSTTINGLMEDIRLASDQLEGVVADEYWPLPKYRELLFIR